ncbi:fimbrial protein [Enterobacillus tribolii]|uniref:Type 1 fimbria pilin n=1 Tax=Enterobacillus tribolii TaxID=1487935 RepID=A0A370QQD9_9GAMM|nr:fimbrial protein [Enterobacillus tribolii]MBW7981602.1 fimbrial protein [Enterobacillus tribolii]RDK90980.1 type 1 fimbria pilin [Enterobacillus tribolii]
MNIWKLIPLALFCLAGTSAGSRAADGGTTQLTISGNIVEPDCVINDNQQIVVNFGEVLTTRIDGSNYETPINYTLSCPQLIRNTLKINLKGTAASFNSGLFVTDVSGLGIRVLDASKAVITPNTGAVNFTYAANNPPALYAIPVAQANVTLPNGAFNGSATMVFSYQ